MKQQPLDNSQLRIMAPSIFATEPYQAMSDKYAFVPTFQILEKLRKEGFYPYQARESRTRIADKRGFTKHMLRLRHVNHALCQQVGDLIPEVVLVNSHDGGCAYQLHAGLFRLVCSNGMTVADSTFEKLSVRHSGDCWIEAVEGVLSIARAMPQIIEKVEDFQAIELSPDERGVFAEAALQLRYPEKAPITAAQLLRPRRYEDNRKDLFATMNVVQEHLIKGGIRGRSLGQTPRRTTTRTVKGIDQDVKLNKALWSLTERMAELKTA
jgi:hypothetical protein